MTYLASYAAFLHKENPIGPSPLLIPAQGKPASQATTQTLNQAFQMVAKFFAFAIFFATAFAKCTPEQLTAHGLTGGKQTVMLSRLERHDNGTTSVFEDGTYLCNVDSTVIWPETSPSDRRAMLGKRCLGRRDVPETLWSRE